MMPTNDEHVADVFAEFNDAIDQLHAAQIADSLDVLGWRDQVFDSTVRPLRPGLRCLGPAMTLQFAPIDRDPGPDPYRDLIEFLHAVGPRVVLVLATPTPERSAVWGELFSAAAIGAGVAGLVSNGCVRDATQIGRLGFPVFAGGTRPLDYRGRQRVIAVGEAVACAGVVVEQGDWVLGDDDGIVAIPSSAVRACLGLATRRLSDERSVLDELMAGAKLGDVWERHGVL